MAASQVGIRRLESLESGLTQPVCRSKIHEGCVPPQNPSLAKRHRKRDLRSPSVSTLRCASC